MDEIVHVSFDLWEIEFHRNYWDVIVMSPFSLFCRIRHVYLQHLTSLSANAE